MQWDNRWKIRRRIVFKFKGLIVTINSSFQFFHKNSMEYEIFRTNKKKMAISRKVYRSIISMRIKNMLRKLHVTILLIALIIIRSWSQLSFPLPKNSFKQLIPTAFPFVSDHIRPRRLLILHFLTFRQKIFTRSWTIILEWKGKKENSFSFLRYLNEILASYRDDNLWNLMKFLKYND